MIKILQGKEISAESIMPRRMQQDSGLESMVDGIILQVSRQGDRALLEYARSFDKAEIDSLVVAPEEMKAAWERIDPFFRETLRQAKENLETYHSRQLREGYVIDEKPGILLGQRVMPLEKVGVYVPGGTARYPSTLLMNAVPAKLAGVKELVVSTPPAPDGTVPDNILAAAYICGVDKVVKCGGAQAVAALAYGTESVPRVDKIVGPGNIYVAVAKRRVYGMVDIDMIAGPSEILVIADGDCQAAFVAADMLSQAEHDPMSAAVLVTDSPALATAVQEELEKQIPLLERSEIARRSIDGNGRIILVESLDVAVDIANEIAPEHLQICVEEPFAIMEKVRNAGSIFLGRNVPEVLGDYFAGTNHTLPTGGTARFSSPLSVDDFVKKSSYIYYSREALGAVCDRVADFAEREGLAGHARSIRIRFEGNE